jgi:hypothetical protein
MMQDNQVKFASTSGDTFCHLANATEQAHLVQGTRRDATADIAYHDGLTWLEPQHMSWIDAHISATDNHCPHGRQ